MTTLTLEQDALAVSVQVGGGKLTVDLADGRTLSVPVAWFPRLLHGSPSECKNWRLLGDGYAIEWPDLDEHIGVEGLLAGRRSGEGTASFKRWLASRRPQIRLRQLPAGSVKIVSSPRRKQRERRRQID